MNLTEESDVIVKHAFESEGNLRIAAKVGLAFDSIKESIVQEFVQSLVVKLKHRLGRSWAVEDSWSQTPLIRRSYIAAHKAKWNENASVGLHCEKTGPSDLDFFVWIGTKQKMPLVSELRDALDEQYAHGQHGLSNPWWKFVDTPYRDWNTEEALIVLWKKDEAVEYYTDHLLKLCKIAGPILDRSCG